MNNQEIFENLKKIVKEENIKQNEPMKNHTTFRIGGPADFYVKVSDIENLKNLLKFVNKNQIPLTVVGNGSNILVKDSGIRGIVLKLDMKNIEINDVQILNKENQQNVVQLSNNKENQKEYEQSTNNKGNQKKEVIVQSGVQIGFLAQILLKNEITGFENLAGIPGTVGGAIIMNAGAYGKEMKDIVLEVTAMDYNGNIHIFSNEEVEFRYRGSKFSKENDEVQFKENDKLKFKENEILNEKNKKDESLDEKYIILSAKLLLESGNKDKIQSKMNEYLELRKEKQPLEFPSAGSTFKRGTDFITAALIDEAGLKGYIIGGAQVSEKHAGFVINKGNATAQNVLDLVKYIQDKVYEKFHKKIELEVKILE